MLAYIVSLYPSHVAGPSHTVYYILYTLATHVHRVLELLRFYCSNSRSSPSPKNTHKYNTRILKKRGKKTLLTVHSWKIPSGPAIWTASTRNSAPTDKRLRPTSLALGEEFRRTEMHILEVETPPPPRSDTSCTTSEAVTPALA